MIVVAESEVGTAYCHGRASVGPGEGPSHTDPVVMPFDSLG